MTSCEIGAGAAAPLLAALADATDRFSTLDLSSMNSDELLTLTREREAQRRCEATFDHALLAELAEQGTAGERDATSLTSLLVDLLRLCPHEAAPACVRLQSPGRVTR